MAKKRIFIGSSLESKELAFKLQKALESRFECVLWYEDFFTIGNHYFTDLIQKIITFDYAIVIGGEDDHVTRISNRAQKISPRDNIHLEYGLFSGILSPNRVLFLIWEGCREASDLTGIPLGVYRDDEDAVSVCCRWLGEKLLSAKIAPPGSGCVELLPTVGIAVGYYYNFIQPFLSRIAGDDSGTLPDRKILEVLIPTYVCDDIGQYKHDIIRRYRLREADICRYRILVDDDGAGELRMYDVPSTILALFKTVDYVFGVTQGNTPDTICAKQRALDNFHDNLAGLMAGDPLAREMVILRRYTEAE